MNMKRTILAIMIFYFLFVLLFNNYTVVGDGVHHYFLLESAILDRDLNIDNQIPRYPNKSTPERITAEIPFGAAIFNAPFYLISLALENFSLFQKEVQVDNRGVLNINVRTASINIASNFYTMLTLLLVILILRGLHLEVSFSIVVACLVSAPLLYYSVFVSSFNHAIDTFVITLFVYLFVKLRDRPAKYQFILGALIAVGAMVRYFDVIFFPMLFIYYLFSGKRDNLKFLTMGFVIFILPLACYVLRDNAYLLRLIPEHFNRQPESPYASFKLYPRYFLDILFSPVHGLFLWSPVTILSSIGLYYFYKDRKETAPFFIGMFFSLVFAYSFCSAWHGSWSFSMRYLTALFSVFVVGLSCFISKHKKWGSVLMVLFTAYSLFLMFNHFLDIMHGEKGTPWDMVRNWASGDMTAKKFIFKVYRISIIDNIFNFLRG